MENPLGRHGEPLVGGVASYYVVNVCMTEAEPWVNASVTDESLTGLREGDSPEVVPLVAVWSGEGWLPRANAGVSNDLLSGTGRGPVVTSGGEALRLGCRSGALSQRIRLGHVRRDDFGSPRGESWSSVKLGGSSSERIQIVIGIPLSAGGDRTMLTTFLADVPIN